MTESVYRGILKDGRIIGFSWRGTATHDYITIGLTPWPCDHWDLNLVDWDLNLVKGIPTWVSDLWDERNTDE